MARILISDPLSKEGLAVLDAAEGMEYDLKAGMSKEELIACIGQYDGLIVRSETKVTADVIEAATRCKVIGRAGVGLDNVDVEAATKKGIIVMNTPDGNTISTAEHTLAMLLAMARKIPQSYTSLRSGKWERKKFVGRELFGKTLGVIGMGRIGTQVVKRAQAFGMKIIAFDPFISEEAAQKLEVRVVDLPELYKEADVITIHTPLSPKTKGLLSTKEFEQMKDGVMILNCARGGIIDETVLYEAMKSGKVGCAALDVFEKEPPDASPLLELDNFIAVPHLGASTSEAQINVGIDIVDQVVAALQGKTARNAVNIPQVEPGVMAILGPYVGLAERLGSLAGQLVRDGLGNINIEYTGDIARYNITPLTVAILKGLLASAMHDSTVNYVNAPLMARERGIKVVESKSDAIEDFANLITISFLSATESQTVSGTVLKTGEEKILKINGFDIEAVPSGHLLILNQTDQPGIIGKVGTIIGQENVNIGGMQLSRIGVGGKAISVWNLDGAIPEHVLAKINELPEITSASMVSL
ncbi:MAG: phosphoglycerate dehydrogenase [bacterium]|nr:phosphoglycerate dehydrogenase [bacterium]